MGTYQSFARVYDLFMDDIDYEGWSRFLTANSGLLRPVLRSKTAAMRS